MTTALSGHPSESVGTAQPSPTAVGARHVVVMLSARAVSFVTFQALIALAYFIGGSEGAWARSGAWWPLTAAGGSLVSGALLTWFLRREGLRYRDLFDLRTPNRLGDLRVVAGVVVLAGLLSVVPSYALAAATFGDAAAAMNLLIQPLPTWAAGLALPIFPVSIALTELPIYMGYVRPRMERLIGRAWVAVIVAAAALSLQHAALPLMFDWRFVLWRSLMFAPLALLFAAVLRWRPRLLVWLVVLHLLADLQAAIQVWTSSA